MANVIKMIVGTDKQGRKGYTTDGNPWNILKGICADENGVMQRNMLSKNIHILKMMRLLMAKYYK